MPASIGVMVVTVVADSIRGPTAASSAATAGPLAWVSSNSGLVDFSIIVIVPSAASWMACRMHPFSSWTAGMVA